MASEQSLKNRKLAKVATIDAFLKSDATFQSGPLAQGGAITAGFEGKVVAIDFAEVKGRNVSVRTAEQGPQTSTFIDKDGKEQTIVIAEVGEPSVTTALIFENGKTVSLSLLQLSGNSTLDANTDKEKHFQTMKGTEFAELIGKTLKCTFFGDDEQAPKVPRATNGDMNNQTMKFPKKYQFETVA